MTGYADLVTQVRMEAGPLDPRRGAGGGGGSASSARRRRSGTGPSISVTRLPRTRSSPGPPAASIFITLIFKPIPGMPTLQNWQD